MNREEGLKTDRRVNGALSDLTVLDLTRVVAGLSKLRSLGQGTTAGHTART